MNKALCALSGALILSACGIASSQSASESEKQPDVTPTGHVRIAIIGNSITSHWAKPDVGWFQSNGMAASNVAHDFAHLLIHKIRATAADSYVRNFYPFETDSKGAADNIASLTPVIADPPEIVVIELGDNVAGRNPMKLAAFDSNYAALLDKVKGAKKLFCLSTWWERRFTDMIIEHQCKAAGGTFVYIGDIYVDPINRDLSLPHYPGAFVDKHPKDYSMQRIAFRLWKAGATL
jgi:hypothetical protein